MSAAAEVLLSVTWWLLFPLLLLLLVVLEEGLVCNGNIFNRLEAVNDTILLLLLVVLELVEGGGGGLKGSNWRILDEDKIFKINLKAADGCVRVSPLAITLASLPIEVYICYI